MISEECKQRCLELLKQSEQRESWINRIYYANIAKNTEEIKQVIDEIAKEYWINGRMHEQTK